jgi:ABC-type antimicrobial peptide transport system permease subunit
MSLLRLIIASFIHHWRMNLAVVLGAAAGTAVLVGALVVGDSMRGSLRSLALDRLGRIDEVLAPGRFFREKLAEELRQTNDYKQYGESLVPAILLPASIENPNTHTRANRIEVIGCNNDFRDLLLPSPIGNATGAFPPSPSGRGAGGEGGREKTLPFGEVDLNQPLAAKLGVKPGDEVVLRLPKPSLIPAESALGNKRDTVQSSRLTVRCILPTATVGRFSLKLNQQEPLNAFVPLGWLQERLAEPKKANALLLSLNDEGRKKEKEWFEPANASPQYAHLYGSWLGTLFRNSQNSFTSDLDIPFRQSSFLLATPQFGGEAAGMKLDDLGLRLTLDDRGFLCLDSDNMIVERDLEAEFLDALTIDKHNKGRERHRVGAIQPLFTYLANAIDDDGRSIPYSTITAIDFAADPPLGPFLSPDGKPLPPLHENEIALNAWAADDLKAKIGDTIKITYFAPESTHGQIQEKSADFKLTAIVALTGAADNRSLTPKVKGVTDELRMSDWDPPFPFDAKRIRTQDEEYWNERGPTPKAFVALATGRKLWASRFGQSTAMRITCTDSDSKKAEGDLLELKRAMESEDLRPANILYNWQPIRLQHLAAAEGTTPFNVLFLAFSFFIIVSSLMLVLLLFKLGVERRAAEIGILLAVGWKPRQIRQLLFGEGMLTALAGGLIGVPLGIGYATLMLWGLQTWWIAAIVAPFLRLHVTPGSLAIGFAAGFLMATVTIFFAVRKISRVAPRKLLAGLSSNTTPGAARTRRMVWIDLVWIIFLSANILFWPFTRRLGNTDAGMFFGSGAITLILTLLVIWNHLRRGATGAAVRVGGKNLARLALRNAARNPGRSTLTIGLVASASFLIVAVSSFRLDPSQQTPTLASGNGGFALVAESSQPIFQNLDTPQGRAAAGFSETDEKTLASCRIYSLRVRAGDDASCLNLYKPRSPRILGLPQAFLDRGGFAWADTPRDGSNPWNLLEKAEQPDMEQTNDDGKLPVPVVLEKNTANYSLGLWRGPGEIYEFPQTADKKSPLQVAALLDNSLFQGDLLVSEDALLNMFPETAGYRFFLVECPPAKTVDVQRILENRLGDYGLAAETTGGRLARFLAVQNTYLSTFQSLGGLGLLLGTLGLAAVQLRNVLERRGELALLRAVGFRRRTLAQLVLLENAVLLLLGLAGGILAAAVAVMPHLLTSNATFPWLSLATTLALVFFFGMLAGLASVRQVTNSPLLGTLREDR